MNTLLLSPSAEPYLLVALGFIAALILRRLIDGPPLQTKIDASLPPSPPSLPFIGNVHQLTKGPLEIQFTEWSKMLGSIFTIKLGVKRWVVLNSINVVKDLIVERSNIYSSRDMPDILTGILFRGDQGAPIPFMTYNDQWRQIRRITHSSLTKAKINDYQPIIDARTNFMIKSLYEASQASANNVIAPVEFFDFYAVSTMFAVIFGANIKLNDERIKRSNEVTQEATRLIGPGEQLMEFFPMFKSLPNTTMELVMAIREKTEAFWDEQYSTLKKRVEEGKAVDCILKEVIATQSKEHLTDLQQVHIGSTLNSAGSEMISITIQWMCAILVHYPEVQDRAFAEIERIVGRNRLPTNKDETLRYRTPAPFAIPHATSREDTYQGYCIPKGTTVVINIHAIHNDPIRYPNPEMFNPGRHIDYVHATDSKIVSEFSDRPHLAFSTGRRLCVGINLAERILFTAISRLLACFRIEFATDELGNRVPVEIVKHNVGNGATCIPIPYKVKLVPRHDGVGRLAGSNM
ncbi:cytochrome P450 [Endogone sp. FLAS-F59071]|nr:cytochrome P450 [Endogone sp. FLAS-F59071]|eukprot:RUS21156.1 cytochrome P450 [Endogone sp. FLAS-F59071]